MSEKIEREPAVIDDAWKMLRQLRNIKLKDCDWTVLSDTPTSTAAWKAYRQALRDLPANTTDPFNVVWPAPPA
jgi:Phage tail assembly chaperone protein